MSQRQRKARAKLRRHAVDVPNRRKLLATSGLALGATLAIGGVAQADTFTVNTNDPYASGDGVLGLSDAIQQADDNPGADLITFASNVTGSIVLDGESLPAVSGDGLEIRGPGAGTLAIDGAFKNEIFNLDAPTTISGLTLKGGYVDGYGGAIYTYAPLVLDHMVLKNNHAEDGGGAVASEGADNGITITNSTLSDNRSDANYDGGGGAVYSRNGDVTLESTTISGNHSEAGGGGVFAEHGEVKSTGSTISGNDARRDGGGVLAKYGNSTLTSSTISDNTAGNDGGGVYTEYGSIDLDGTTVSGNTGDYGGGLYAWYGDGINVGNQSTISGNTARFDGGGIYSDRTTVNVDASKITGNVAATPQADFFDSYGAYGGGIAMNGADLSITGSSITDNVANGIYSAGGGILADGTLSIDHSTISGNQAADGGGVYMRYTDAQISNSKLSGNKASYAAGGLAGYEFGGLVDSSTISDNSARYGGGIGAQYGGMLLDHSTVSGNTASEFGGGIAARGMDYLGMANSSISGNTADVGGGMYGGDVLGLIDHSTVANNSAKHGAGGLASIESLLDMESSTVAGNSAGENDDSIGGGVLSLYGLSLLDSSTIAHNAAEFAGGVDADALPFVSQHERDAAAAASGRADRAARRLERRKARAAARAAKRDARLTAEGRSAKANRASLVSARQESHVRRSAIGEGTLSDCGLPAALQNSIVAENTAAHTVDDQDLLSANVASLFSLVESTTSTLDDLGVGGSNLVGVDPKLGPLQNNGGPTQTVRPQAGSPAIDTGSTEALDLPCPNVREAIASARKSIRARGADIAVATTQDQRGFDRPIGAPAVTFPFGDVANLADGADMGAVEIQPGEFSGGGGGAGQTTPQEQQPGPSNEQQDNNSAPARVETAFKALLARLQNGSLKGNHLTFTDVFPEDGSAIYGLDLSFFSTGVARSAKVHAPIHLASKRVKGTTGQVKVNIRLSKRALKLLLAHPGGHLVVRSHFVSAGTGKSATTRRALKVRRPKRHRIH